MIWVQILMAIFFITWCVSFTMSVQDLVASYKSRVKQDKYDVPMTDLMVVVLTIAMLVLILYSYIMEVS